jgi:hypothetical protein
MRNVIVANDTDGYHDGRAEAAAQVKTTDKAREVLTYFAFNPPSDPFDFGVMDEVLDSFGH